MAWAKKMQEKWGVGPWGVIAILIAFSLAGSSVVRVRKPILHYVLPEGSPLWLNIVMYLLLIFPLYQFFLLLYGSLLGQFRFFWSKEKKMFLWFRKRLFRF